MKNSNVRYCGRGCARFLCWDQPYTGWGGTESAVAVVVARPSSPQTPGHFLVLKWVVVVLLWLVLDVGTTQVRISLALMEVKNNNLVVHTLNLYLVLLQLSVCVCSKHVQFD